MNSEWYQLKLGIFECFCISDGNMNYPPGNLFVNVPKSQIEEALCQSNMPIEYIQAPIICLFIRTPQHQILVDLGANSITTYTGRLLENMKKASIKPEDIDSVIITHAHPAHIGGILNNKKLTYANASYFMSKDEWNYWMSGVAMAKSPERHVAIARKNLKAIQDRVTLIDSESEIFPGISMLPAPGNTPGHMVVSVASSNGKLLYISDTVFHPLHLEHPEWLPIYDVMPEKAAVSKQRIFDRAVEEKSLVLGAHFPFPGLGYVIKKGNGWEWQPIEELSQKVGDGETRK